MSMIGLEPQGECAASPGGVHDSGSFDDAIAGAGDADRAHPGPRPGWGNAAGEPMCEHLVHALVSPAHQLLHGPMAGESLGDSLRQPGGPSPSICRFGRASRGAPTLSRHRCSDAAGAQIHHTQIHQVKSGGRFGYGGSAAGQDMSKG
jgi:hypothetical protein